MSGERGFKFGDRVTQGYASKDNPRKHCIFVKMNRNGEATVTDGMGEFWSTGNEKLELTPPSPPQPGDTVLVEAEQWETPHNGKVLVVIRNTDVGDRYVVVPASAIHQAPAKKGEAS